MRRPMQLSLQGGERVLEGGLDAKLWPTRDCLVPAPFYEIQLLRKEGKNQHVHDAEELIVNLVSLRNSAIKTSEWF